MRRPEGFDVPLYEGGFPGFGATSSNHPGEWTWRGHPLPSESFGMTFPGMPEWFRPPTGRAGHRRNALTGSVGKMPAFGMAARASGSSMTGAGLRESSGETPAPSHAYRSCCAVRTEARRLSPLRASGGNAGNEQHGLHGGQSRAWRRSSMADRGSDRSGRGNL